MCKQTLWATVKFLVCRLGFPLSYFHMSGLLERELLASREAQRQQTATRDALQRDARQSLARNSLQFLRNFVARAEPTIRTVCALELHRVEVKAELGVMCHNKFHSRVRETDEHVVCNALSSPSKIECQDYWYEQPARLLQRYNAHCSEVTRQGAYIRIVVSDGDILRCNLNYHAAIEMLPAGDNPRYDVRMYVSVVVDLPALTQALQDGVPAGWSRVRHRTLMTFNLSDWDITLASVVTDNIQKTREIEATLVLSNMPAGAPRDRSEWLEQRAQQLWDVFLLPRNRISGLRREFGPCSHNQLLCNAKVADETVARHLAILMTRAQGGHGVSDGQFRGVLPRALDKHTLTTVLVRDGPSVVVAEKTDGERMQLVITNNGVWLHTRNDRFFPLTAGWSAAEQIFVGAFSRNGVSDTVLDGEIVCDGNDNLFVVFDVLMLMGMPCSKMSFAERRRYIDLQVCPRIRAAVASHRCRMPFHVVRKQFMALEDYGLLWRRMTRVKGRRCIRMDEYVVPIDGLIFVHSPAGGPETHYKWKPLSGITADFAGRLEGSVLTLSAGVDSSEMVRIGTLSMTPDQLQEHELLLVDNEMVSRASAWQRAPRVLFECALDSQTREWKLVRLRTDKTQPNHVSVVLDTVATMLAMPTHQFIARAVAKMLVRSAVN